MCIVTTTIDLAESKNASVSEEKFLHQLNLEEQFGVLTRVPEVPIEGKKKVPGAAIGFNYDDPTAPVSEAAVGTDQATGEDEDVEEDEDSDIDFDVCVDVNKVTTDQAHELNSSALPYGMESNDFFSFLTKDREEADNLRIAKELEEEKAMYSGRKSRRERRAYREKKLAGRIISPPSYASRKSPTYCDYTREGTRSRSRSDSPVNAGKITYITSYGGEEQPTSQMPPSPKLKHTSKSKRHSRSRSRSPNSASRRRRSRSRSLRSSHRRSPKRTMEGEANRRHRNFPYQKMRLNRITRTILIILLSELQFCSWGSPTESKQPC
ncbi:unnamed protein product [Nesidiocoris tenuis]|uniref:CLK4-associating serine/arginine rich protein n=1 Tax=Nesidiocoris tenuis TaxID=355587 RepID=A0A6H5GJ59_9HEMI|nr:unnamed protein product [Nesidiocoris tenuis]